MQISDVKMSHQFLVIIYFFIFFRLRFVSVANIYSLTDQTMNALAHYTGPNLIALDVRGCWRITDRGVAVVSEYCPNLRVLNVTDCRFVNLLIWGFLHKPPCGYARQPFRPEPQIKETKKVLELFEMNLGLLINM